MCGSLVIVSLIPGPPVADDVLEGTADIKTVPTLTSSVATSEGFGVDTRGPILVGPVLVGSSG